MVEIYVALLNEGTAVWRPVKAEQISEGVFRILPENDYDPSIEDWEFLPGTIVQCEFKKLNSGAALVAVRAK